MIKMLQTELQIMTRSVVERLPWLLLIGLIFVIGIGIYLYYEVHKK